MIISSRTCAALTREVAAMMWSGRRRVGRAATVAKEYDGFTWVSRHYRKSPQQICGININDVRRRQHR